jgi:hypothetical protein
MNATITKFGYPHPCCANTRIGSSSFAPVQTHARQSRARVQGRRELARRGFGDGVRGAFHCDAELERALRAAFDYQKVNYLALMMVDPHVHFHVIPRYSEAREFEGSTFLDAAWPKPPDLTSALTLSQAQ